MADNDDLPPKPANDPDISADDSSFGGTLGRTFAGAMWVAVFAVVAGAFLWAVIHWFG